jgi:hypothetical protein
MFPIKSPYFKVFALPDYQALRVDSFCDAVSLKEGATAQQGGVNLFLEISEKWAIKN